MSVPAAFLTASGLVRLAWDGRYSRPDGSRQPGGRLMRIERWDQRLDGVFTPLALQQKLDALGYVVSTCDWAAGTVIPEDVQEHERVGAVAAGLLKFTVDGESAILIAGDIVFVPRGAVRRIEVVGAAPAQCLDAVYHDDDPRR
ncbi:MAG: cupin domain-containing protein [Acidobacteria bacterium]|nr:cupin domain-containing protein [Acidobacteriota bacterium]